jgi:hypothetical protein
MRWFWCVPLAVLCGCFARRNVTTAAADEAYPACASRPVAPFGSAYAWTNHMPAVSVGDEPAQDVAPFSLIVTLPTEQAPPSAIEVERADQRWTAAAVRDSSIARPDSAKYVVRGDPPMWLDRADSIDVCLTVGRGPAAKVIRLRRTRVIETA